MSFNMGNNSMNNGPMMGPNYRGGLPAAPNGYATYPPQPPPNYKPSIYTVSGQYHRGILSFIGGPVQVLPIHIYCR